MRRNGESRWCSHSNSNNNDSSASSPLASQQMVIMGCVMLCVTKITRETKMCTENAVFHHSLRFISCTTTTNWNGVVRCVCVSAKNPITFCKRIIRVLAFNMVFVCYVRRAYSVPLILSLILVWWKYRNSVLFFTIASYAAKLWLINFSSVK